MRGWRRAVVAGVVTAGALLSTAGAASAAISVRGPGTVSEAAGSTAVFTVSREGLGPGTTVRVTTRGGEAAAGADFTAVDCTITFDLGQASVQVPVAITDDRLDEAGEGFSLVLSAAVGEDLATGAGASATTVIVDDDPPPAASVGPASVTEGTGVGNGGLLRVPIALSTPSGRDVLVDATTTSGTALAGEDFTAVSGRLRIPAGQTAASVDVTVTPDGALEPDETFSVTIRSPDPDGLTIAVASATATIRDDDSPTTSSPTGPSPSAPATPGPGPTALAPDAPVIGALARRGGGRTIVVGVTCPVAASRCRGTVTVFSVAVPKAKQRLLRVQRLLGSARFSLKPGGSARVTLRVRSAARPITRRAKRRVTTYAVSRDATDTTTVAQRSATLR